MSINLLEETKTAILDCKKKIKDISFIGSFNKKKKNLQFCSWKQFEKIANIEYEEGYGGNKISLELVIVFKDETWLKREEYDGLERWKFFSIPTKEGREKGDINIFEN